MPAERTTMPGFQQRAHVVTTWVVQLAKIPTVDDASLPVRHGMRCSLICYIMQPEGARKGSTQPIPISSIPSEFFPPKGLEGDRGSPLVSETKMSNFSSSQSNKPCHVRSISLPSRSHPLSVRVEEGLQKVKTWATSSLLQASSPTAEALCIALESLEEMYSCVEELLRLPHTQQALARHRCEKWVAEELDSSVKLLDVCGTARDAISSVKEQAQDLQSALRTRRGADSIAEAKICAFIRSRKMADKHSSKCLKSLKQLEKRCPVYPLPAADHDLSLTLKAVKDLREISILIFESFSSFMAKPASSSLSKWWLPTARTCRDEIITSELDKADALLRYIHGKSLRKDVEHERVHEAQTQLQRLEDGMDGLETGLESLHRRLIQNRVSLLNIFSL